MLSNLLKIIIGIGLIIGGGVLEVMWLVFIFGSVVGVILLLFFAPHLFLLPWTLGMSAGLAVMGTIEEKSTTPTIDANELNNTVDLYDYTVNKNVEEIKSDQEIINKKVKEGEDKIIIKTKEKGEGKINAEGLLEDKIGKSNEKVNIENKIKKNVVFVKCPNCGFLKSKEIPTRGNTNIKCSDCKKIFSVKKNTIDSVKCPKCGEVKSLSSTIISLKNMSTKCHNCYKIFENSKNLCNPGFEKEKKSTESQSISGKENEYFDTYEDAIVTAKKNPRKVVKRGQDGRGFILADMELDLSEPVIENLEDDDFNDDIPF